MSRKLLLILLIPALLLVGGYIYIRFQLRGDTSVQTKPVDSLGNKKVSALDLRPLFIQRMQELLKKSSNGLYDLSVGDMQVDVLKSTIALKGVKLLPDSIGFDSLKKADALPADVYSVSFDGLEIEGVNLDDAVTSKTMDYKSIKLRKPVISIYHQRKKEEGKMDSSSFSQRFLKEMQKLSINNLVIEDGEISVYSKNSRKPTSKLESVKVELNNVLVDSTTRMDKDRFLFAKAGTLSFKNFTKPTKDGLYELKVGEAVTSSSQPELVLKNFSFTSPLSKSDFVKRQRQSKELYQLSLPSISMTSVDWWTLLNEEEIVAKEVKAVGGKLSIFLDRSLSPKNKMGNFPSQLIMKMPMKIDIERFSLSNLKFSYEEYNPISQQSGTVSFDDVTIAVENISNMISKPTVVNGSALFMHKVPLQANFVFDMKNYKTGNFTTHIKASGFDGTIINDFAPAMGLMKIEKGTVQKAEATISGSQSNASGDVLILYKDLKLALMEKEKGEKTLDKKGFTSLVANLIVLKKDNDGNPPRKATVTFKRIPEGGFFMLIWKTMLLGVLKTIGAPEKLAYKTIATAKKQ